MCLGPISFLLMQTVGSVIVHTKKTRELGVYFQVSTDQSVILTIVNNRSMMFQIEVSRLQEYST